MFFRLFTSFALIAFVPVICGDAAQYGCPKNLLRDKYLQIGEDKCYKFVFHKEVEFSDARDYCVSLGGDLAMPKTKAINNFLYGKLKQEFYYETRYIRKMWIGLTDLEREGTYKWVDGTPMRFNNFGNLEGNRNTFLPTHRITDCMVMRLSDGRWVDTRCQNILFFKSRYQFICEFEMEKKTTTSIPTTKSHKISTKQPATSYIKNTTGQNTPTQRFKVTSSSLKSTTDVIIEQSTKSSLTTKPFPTTKNTKQNQHYSTSTIFQSLSTTVPPLHKQDYKTTSSSENNKTTKPTRTVSNKDLAKDQTIKPTFVSTKDLAKDQTTKPTRTVSNKDLGKDQTTKPTRTVSTKDFAKEQTTKLTRTVSTKDFGKDQTTKPTRTVSSKDLRKDQTTKPTRTVSSKDLGKDQTTKPTRTVSSKDLGKDQTTKPTRTVSSKDLGKDQTTKPTRTVSSKDLGKDQTTKPTRTVSSKDLGKDQTTKPTRTVSTKDLGKDQTTKPTTTESIKDDQITKLTTVITSKDHRKDQTTKSPTKLSTNGQGNGQSQTSATTGVVTTQTTTVFDPCKVMDCSLDCGLLGLAVDPVTGCKLCACGDDD